MAQIIIFIILVLYMILLFLVGKNISKSTPCKPIKYQPKVAVVIAFRNEKENINILINSLLQQEYQNFNVFLINDHSNDCFLDEIADLKDERLHILSLPEGKNGKKSALEYGVNLSKSELLLFSDADCWMNKNWISSMVASLENSDSDWQAGAIKVVSSSSWIERFQELESAYLVALSALGIAKKLPTSCNGANIILKREAFCAVNGFEGIELTPSGDDELLMQKLFKKGFVLNFCKNRESFVYTKALATGNQMLNQRIRWASKLKYNLLKNNLVLSGMVFSVHFSSILIFFLDFKLGFLFLFCRFVAEYLLARIVSKWLFFSQKNIHFIFSFFAYPLYVMFMCFASQFKAFDWKERKYN